jgi:deoxyribonuclease-4
VNGKSMMTIGCHLSVARGFLAMGRDALAIDATTFQFFTRNPRGSKAKAIDPADIAAFLELAAEHRFAPLLAHAPYTLNPCSADPKTREFALETMRDDLARLELLPGNLYNFHPGSHVGQGEAAGIALITAQLNAILTPHQTTTVLLETMAGKGSEVGRSFQELRAILDGVVLRDKMGVCLDTCHVHDAGYDIVDDLDGVLAEFDAVIGLDRLRAVHLNDSLNPRGSRKDRHARIGHGRIGLAAITRIINHPCLLHLPFLLETPNELPGYAAEIALLRGVYQG